MSLTFTYAGERYQHNSAKVWLRDLACIFSYLISGKTLKYILRFSLTRKKTQFTKTLLLVFTVSDTEFNTKTSILF